MARLRSCSWVLLSLLVACEQDDPDPGPPPVPSLARVNDEALEAHPGEPISLEVRVTAADGMPASGYEASWNVPCEAATSTGAGTEICTWRPTDLGLRAADLRVVVCDGPRWNPRMHCPETTITAAWVMVWGGAPKAVKAPITAATMVVGEVRPLQAVVLANGSLSHVAPTYRVVDPAIASVDAFGVVTALRTGSSELQIAAGDASTRVQLGVIAGEPGPPPSAQPIEVVAQPHEVVSSNGFAEVGVSLRRDNAMWLDAGYPWLVYRTLSKVPDVAETQARNVWVSGWTGSGFGYEAVGEGWDDLQYPQIVVDEHGTAWVLAHSRIDGDFVVMRRDAPGRWSRLPLPSLADPTALLPASGAGVATRISEYQSESIAMALHPKAGGGVFSAYVTWDRATESEVARTGKTCARSVRLATVQPDGSADAEDVARDLYGSGDDCAAWVSLDEFTLDALFVDPDTDGAPRVLIVREALDLGFLRVAQKAGGTWTDTTVIPWSAAGSLPAYEQAPTQLTLVRSEIPGGPTEVMWTGRGTFFAPLDALLAHTAEPIRDFVAASGGGYPGDQVLFAAKAGGAVYAGTSTLGPISVRRPDGGVTFEDPTPRLFPVDDPYLLEPYHLYTLVRATAGDELRWHVTWGMGDLTYATLDVPEFARPDDSDARGRRVSAEPTTPRRSPIVLADAWRVVATDKGLYHSPGPDQPWTLARATTGTLRDDLSVVGSAILGFDLNLSGRLDVVRSTDHGVTFTRQWTIDVGAQPAGAAVISGGGVPFVLVGQRLVRGLESGPVDVSQPEGWPSPKRLLAAPNGVLVLGTSNGGKLRAARVADDGTVLEIGPATELAIGERGFESAAATSDGLVCVLADQATGTGLALTTHCSDDLFATVHSNALTGSAYWDPLVFAGLSDGAMALGLTRTASFEERRAEVLVTHDRGATWSVPIAPRPVPRGGYGQKVYGMASEGDSLLVMLGDNGSWRAWTGGELQVGPASYETVIVTLSPP